MDRTSTDADGTPDCEQLTTITRESAAAGSAVAAASFRTDLDVEQKSEKTDLVTAADRKAEAAVEERIRESMPEATIYGEESATGELPEEGTVWIVDPIDGTNNFVRENRRWATSVACLVDGEAVAAVNDMPALGDTYVGTPEGIRRNGEPVSVSDRSDPETFQVVPTVWWPRDRRREYGAATGAIVRRFGDLRRVGSAQAALSLLAAGSVEGVLTNVETNAWDTVAGVAMVRWAGGEVTDLDGEPWTPQSRGLVASNGNAHEELLKAVAEIDAAR
ncbi:inositol monophosphatase family protein [Natronoarchaeum sp. GCM10025703]|uniref:inositol monophosphatase family protein n=1 Tax=unclassified Natronoarchaeum TaxID=2620183 RepID=UPI0036090A5A